MQPTKNHLDEYEKGIENLSNVIKKSEDFSIEEERLVIILRLLEGNVADRHIPLLIKPLKFLGGPVLPPAIVRTVGSIGSSKAFDTILQILKDCFEGGRSEEVTANECAKMLDEIDAQRAEREGVDDILEGGWF